MLGPSLSLETSRIPPELVPARSSLSWGRDNTLDAGLVLGGSPEPAWLAEGGGGAGWWQGLFVIWEGQKVRPPQQSLTETGRVGLPRRSVAVGVARPQCRCGLEQGEVFFSRS